MKKNHTHFVLHRTKARYPATSSYFNPSTLYPEYPWHSDEISLKKNHIYDMVREILISLNFDKENYGEKKWNPLKGIIKPGMTVLIKPNMVLSDDTTGLDPKMHALVTHPSLVRAIIDYIVIALNGKGSIIIADAPLQSCDFRKLTLKMGYDRLVKFVAKQGINIKLIDLRQYVTHLRSDNYLEPVEASGDPLGYQVVGMGNFSAHKAVHNRFDKYRVTNYDHRKMQQYHDGKSDRYLIANTVLNSDVIISLPKLKTHRKAGMTGSLKNFIGIIGHKDCLPHHSTGSINEGGDEYLYKNWYKKMAVRFIEQLNLAMISKKVWLFPILSKSINFFSKIAYRTQKDNFSEGSWYGNDTIWRTTLDLVRIAMYADKKGVLHKQQQRQIFTLIDAIIGGEKEGPLHPSPKHSGIIAASLNPAILDAVIATLMGFDYKKVPTIRESFLLNHLKISTIKPDRVLINSNNEIWNSVILDLNRETSLKFIPTDGWKGHIEKELATIQTKKVGVIYTCITGNYDNLITHHFINNEWHYVCFTDQVTKTKKLAHWELRPLVYNKMDNVKNQRWHKLHPHILFPEYQKSIYLDANIDIRAKEIFNDVASAIDAGQKIAINKHFERINLYDEFASCLNSHKDKQEVIKRQLALIKKTDFQGFLPNNVFFENNIIYREHHDPQVVKTMNDWWMWIKKYSYRDQLSLAYVVWKNNLSVSPLSPVSYRYQPSVSFTYTAKHASDEQLRYLLDHAMQELARLKQSKYYLLRQKIFITKKQFTFIVDDKLRQLKSKIFKTN